MKKYENNFAVTGYVAKDAEVYQFTNTSVARFPLAVARQEKIGEETKRISAFMNIEAWRKNENSGSFDQLTKGTLLTVEGYFKPEEWSAAQPHRDGCSQILSGCREGGRSSFETGKRSEKGQEVIPVFLTKRLSGRFCFARSLP